MSIIEKLTKNLSIEYIYVEQNLNRSWDIWLQSWPCRSQKWETLSLLFWLWRQVPENWQLTRDFMLWCFLSWGIDYRIKSEKTKSGRITSWNFVHPISHCALQPGFLWNIFQNIQAGSRSQLKYTFILSQILNNKPLPLKIAQNKYKNF
jgi:hypothetical protein